MAVAVAVDSVLLRCASFSHILQIQAHLTTTGLLHSHPPTRAKLLDLSSVAPFARIPHALQLLHALPEPTTRDFNAPLRGFARSPHPRRALALYTRLSSLPQPRPDAVSCSFALQASARVSAAPEASQLHCHALRLGFLADVILRTTLVDAYAKSGELDPARKVFDEMPHRDITAWNALICGLALGTRPHESLALFRRIAVSEEPNDVTVIGALGDGEWVHAYARERGLTSNVRVCNALIDMYAKCGSLDRAAGVFRSMPERSLVSWNTILMALALHGRGAEAVRLFHEMGGAVEPDGITYLAVLSGCNHAGLVDEGLRVFHAMRAPRGLKHYGAVVDLLGRAGRLREAYELVASMPVERDVVLWQTLLGACKTYGDVGMAERVSGELAGMGSNGCGELVLLSNVYAAKGRWADVGRVRGAMRKGDVRKVPGFSFTEVGGEVLRFVTGDRGHRRWREIYGKLEEMRAKVSELGYVAETGDVLHDVGEEEKENAVFLHSEKVAIAFALLGTPADEDIHVRKNVRICVDCHAMAKLLSRAYRRVIVVRDRARFHRFEGGACSCGDYW